jgi:hypothetical protein
VVTNIQEQYLDVDWTPGKISPEFDRIIIMMRGRREAAREAALRRKDMG